MIIAIAILILVLIVVLFMGYKKAPPDTAFIISGLRKKIVIGKATVRIPFFERLDKLSLKLIPVDVKTSSAVPTADYINISVDAVVNVKISTADDKIKVAAENFLNQPTDYIGRVAREVLEGNMREIVGKMRLEEMVSDRQKFAELVRQNADPDLAAMGLEIVSFNVQNFTDTNGVIDDLGIDNISQIKKKAAIAKAEADRDIAIANSEAERKSNEARVNAQREIAVKNNELALQQAALKKEADTAQAAADAAYDIQKEVQRKTVEEAKADANIAAQAKEIELKQKEAEVAEQALNAEIRKRADAELYRKQKEADARQYEENRKAEAEKYKKQQEAAGILEVGKAEAEAIKLKGLAEAEAMEKKAEAYAKYGQAAITEMLVQILPDVARAVAEPLQQIDKITIYGGEGGSGVGSIGGNVPAVMARTFDTIKDATGIDLTKVAMGESIDAKVKREVKFDANMPEIEKIIKEKELFLNDEEEVPTFIHDDDVGIFD